MNVYVWMNEVTSNDAVAYLHLADLFDGLAKISICRVDEIFDRYVTTKRGGRIAIDGTKGEIDL